MKSLVGETLLHKESCVTYHVYRGQINGHESSAGQCQVGDTQERLCHIHATVTGQIFKYEKKRSEDRQQHAIKEL